MWSILGIVTGKVKGSRFGWLEWPSKHLLINANYTTSVSANRFLQEGFTCVKPPKVKAVTWAVPFQEVKLCT